jgi:O-antigen ligase
MRSFFEKFDALASIETTDRRARLFERLAFFFLVLMTFSMPHSIAATQSAWILGMLCWIVRFFFKPRPRLVKTPLDIALWAFFLWTVVSSVFSYAPDISLDKLRGASLFLIFYFVINNVRSLRAAGFLALALVFSCMVNVVWTPIERVIGRGVEIGGVAAESPLAKAFLSPGDTLLKANGKRLKTPEDVLAEIERNEVTKIEYYRPDFYAVAEVKRADLLPGASALERLGIDGWEKSRNWRSQGFYGHYATYAEVLQLIASLVFGLFIAFLTQWRKDARSRKLTVVFFICLCAMSFALLLTVTRASQLAFMISAFSIVILSGSRRLILALAVVALPVALGGLIFLQQSREVGFFDRSDESISWRQTVWREGFELWTKNARNFTLGVGMDSIKRYAKQWRLFDDGRLPMGHFHSTPLQLVVERGFPALLLWLWILYLYGKTLIRGMKNEKWKMENGKWKMENAEEKPARSASEENSVLSTQYSALSTPNSALAAGVLLGCFGGAVGFVVSGLVHYNLGDAEVAMVFFLLMGLGIKFARQK